MERNTIYYFYSNLFLLVVLTWWTRNTFKISMKLHWKKIKIIFETLFSPSFDVPHNPPIVLWTTQNLSFRIYFYIATKRSKKITIIFSTFVMGWNTLPDACSDLDLTEFDGQKFQPRCSNSKCSNFETNLRGIKCLIEFIISSTLFNNLLE